MDSTTPGFRMISSIMIGAAGGVLMASVLLFLFQRTGYALNTASLFLTAVIASAIPWCMQWVEKRGIYPFPAEFLMTAVSLIICLLYMHEASGNELAAASMTRAFVIVHAVSGITTLIRYILRRSKENL